MGRCRPGLRPRNAAITAVADFSFWDERYARSGFFYGTAPNVFLTGAIRSVPSSGQVLSVGDGEGRNGVWLAAQGYRVTTVDGSAVAVDKAKELAATRGVAIAAHCADLLGWEWPVAQYDAVAAIFVHFMPGERPLVHARMRAALKPGGIIVIEAFHPRQHGRPSGGPPIKEMLYDRAMLAADFADTEIVLLEETAIDLDEGRHHGAAEVTRLIARRPAQ